MKKLLITFLLFLTMKATAWIPYDDTSKHMIRVVASSSNYDSINHFFNSMDVQGQMYSVHLGQSNIAVGTLFKLGKEMSKMGVHLTYPINELISISVAGDVSNQADWGGGFNLHGHFPLGGANWIQPYFEINNEKIGGAGVVYYFSIGITKFHLGLGMMSDFKKDTITGQLVFGTTFDNFKNFDKIMKESKGV